MDDIALIFIELGIAIIGLAILAHLAGRWGFSAIPLYLLAGLAFGNGGILPLQFSEDFVHVGAEIGVLLLLFMLGLEYSGGELGANLRSGLPAGLVDFLLNFPPGLLLGWWLGWPPLAAVLRRRAGGAGALLRPGGRLLYATCSLEPEENAGVIAELDLESLPLADLVPAGVARVCLAGGGVVILPATWGDGFTVPLLQRRS